MSLKRSRLRGGGGRGGWRVTGANVPSLAQINKVVASSLLIVGIGGARAFCTVLRGDQNTRRCRRQATRRGFVCGVAAAAAAAAADHRHHHHYPFHCSNSRRSPDRSPYQPQRQCHTHAAAEQCQCSNITRMPAASSTFGDVRTCCFRRFRC